MTELLLVRHGVTTWNDDGRIQGWAPVPLADRGREQARRVAAALAERHDPDAVVASDLRRCAETAAPIADAAGVAVETDRRLRERDFGVYQGLDSADFFERYPELDLLEAGEDAAKRAPERGENWYGVQARALDAYRDLADRGGTVVAVTHVNPIRLILGELKGLDVVSALTEQPVGNCSVTRVVDGDVATENDTTLRE